MGVPGEGTVTHGGRSDLGFLAAPWDPSEKAPIGELTLTTGVR
jgi:hypothetical protein